MTFDEIAEKRVSVRKFDAERTISIDNLRTVIDAARLAPSWKNSQTARYHLVTDRTVFSRLLKGLSPRNAENAEGASALLVTTFVKDVAGFRDGHPDNELGNGWGIYDAGISNSYVLLKAAECGIDSLVMGIRDAEAIRLILNIPNDEVVLSVIALGYRVSSVARPRRKELDDILKIY